MTTLDMFCNIIRYVKISCLFSKYFPDMKEGTIGDMAMLGITESFQVKRQVLLSAAEAAEVILRVDNIIKAAPRYHNTLKNIS